MLLGAELNMIKSTVRRTALRQMLIDRRREMQDEVQDRLRDSRAARLTDARDEAEASDANNQGDLGVALLQMQSEGVLRINEALRRLDAGSYGSCAECQTEIAERRLRALPFAIRCQRCEQGREEAQGHAQLLAGRRGTLSLFPEVLGP
jgi:DnaK suppressor protein